MRCACGKISTILKEDADGTVEPVCEDCYYNPKFEYNGTQAWGLVKSRCDNCTINKVVPEEMLKKICIECKENNGHVM